MLPSPIADPAIAITAAALLPNGELFSTELKNGIYARAHLKGKK